MRKRNHIIPLHLNKKELAHLEAQVKLSGLAREEFLRSLIMGASCRRGPVPTMPTCFTRWRAFATTPTSLPKSQTPMARPAGRAWRK